MKEQTTAVKPKKSEETRERIMTAALELFREKGFQRTTMRDIAAKACLALGAAYYYFDSKEKIVIDFYQHTQDEMEELCEAPFQNIRDLKGRLKAMLDLKFQSLKPYRKFLAILFREAADPDSPLSPFGEDSKKTRETSIELFRRAVHDSDMNLPSDMKEYLPGLLWLYHMGLILFWIHDRSKGQARSRLLREKTLNLIIMLIRLSKLPMMGTVRRAALDLARI